MVVRFDGQPKHSNNTHERLRRRGEATTREASVSDQFIEGQQYIRGKVSRVGSDVRRWRWDTMSSGMTNSADIGKESVPYKRHSLERPNQAFERKEADIPRRAREEKNRGRRKLTYKK